MRALVAVAALLAASCGYVGEPLPPLLNIPERVEDLRVMQRSSKLIVEFTLPKLTTEGTAIKRAPRVELRAGESEPGAFSVDDWAAKAEPIEVPLTGHVSLPIDAKRWIGKEIFFGVRVTGDNGRAAGWSNIVRCTVVQPLQTPSAPLPRGTAGGVLLTWKGSGAAYRVLRRAAGEEQEAVVGRTAKPEWLDPDTQFGKRYTYRVQAVERVGGAEAESEISEPREITPKDDFSPAPPAGLKAVPGTESIELAWEPNSEPDLAGYRVYRDGQRLTDTQQNPSFSDKGLESGKVVQYAITSVDRLGNESNPSPALEVRVP